MRRLGSTLVLVVAVAACGGDNAETSIATSAPPTTAGSPTTSVDAADTTSTTAPTDGQGEPVRLEATVDRAAPSPDAPVEGMVAGYNEAGFDLWRTQPVGEGLVFSPISIGHALTMARAAADETTGAAIEGGLSLPSGMAAHEAWNALDQSIASAADDQDDVTVTVADRIWPRVGLEPDQEWIDLLASHHGASVEALDYVEAPDASREVINGWVSDQTDGLIPQLLPAGFIRSETLLILTDAVYFEARWKTPFGKYQEETGEFTRLDGSTVETSFMRELELGDRRGTGEGFVGAEIPYAGGDFSMLVIVPDQGRFEEMRGRLSQGLLDEIDGSFTTGPYELLLPKWEDDTQLDLMAWLEQMGAAPGRYPAIAPDAFLGAAVHGADIAVDEEGTVAAAATALGFEESGPPEPELTVAADQPYLYLIRHRPSGAVLFAGQVTDPH